MTSRIDVIGQNGPDGESYLVEQVARLIAGDHADRTEFPKTGKQLGWEAHIKQAMAVIEAVRGFDVSNKPDIPWEVVDNIALASLKSHYTLLRQEVDKENKLIKAFKRVIEYYGGGVENE